jgi:hypothetical protein
LGERGRKQGRILISVYKYLSMKIRELSLFKLLLTLILFLIPLKGISEHKSDTISYHDLTIYVTPSIYPLSWDSPSALYSSAIKSYKRSIFNKGGYMIGHLFIELSADEAVYEAFTSIRSISGRANREMIVKDRVGLGILGAPIPGRMESREELEERIEFLKKRGEIAFITFRISDESAHRISQFVERFTYGTDGEDPPSRKYGGAYNPRFEGEGAGCSAFGLTALELAGINFDYPEWRVDINIPMDLIGGEFNNGKRVRTRDIRRRNQWHSGDGEEGVDYVRYFIYDPSLIFRWIIDKYHSSHGEKAGERENSANHKFIPVTKGDIPGLFLDALDIPTPKEPIFFKRPEPSFFISR